MRVVAFTMGLLVAALAPWASAADRGVALGQEPEFAEPAVVEVGVKFPRVQAEPNLYEGEPLQVRIKAIADADVFVYIVYHDANGESALIFPNSAERDNRVAAQSHRTVPASDGGILFVIAPPFGRESLQIISAPRPLPELEQIVDENEGAIPTLPVDELHQLCEQWTAEHALFAIHDSEFETLPGDGHSVQSDEILERE